MRKIDNVTLNGVEVDAVCRDCGATEGLVWVTDHENFEEFPVCENPQECYERQEENTVPFWAFMGQQ